jgi:hypothetical protein
MDTNKHSLEPVFDFATSKSNVLIHKSQAEICINESRYTGDGEVRLDLLPRANIHIYGGFNGVSKVDAMDAVFAQERISSFSINGRQIEGFLLDIGGDATAQELTVKWRPKFVPINGVGDDSTQMIRLAFHLFNFLDLIGTRRTTEQSGTKTHSFEHVDLICDEWKVELKSLVSTRDNFKTLVAEGGYGLTHIGSLEKTDGTPFTGKDANEFLTAVRFFLSFAKGCWCEPSCAVGFDASGNRVWESWSSPREPWSTPPSWFDPQNSSQLATLFPGFMTRWANDDWREALIEVIYWHLNANNSSRGIDTGIILTQAAIERLSYEYAVKDKRLLTVKGFKDIWASDKFRLLFSSIGLPLDIPIETPELKKLASNSPMNWLDAPHALTEIRNSLVHPEHKQRGQLKSSYYEAWKLGLWYLELAILRLCDYSGTYGNRLKQQWVGQVENVPWKK